MPQPVIRCDQVGKTFCRSTLSAILYGAADLLRRLFRQRPARLPRQHEFCALHGVSFEAGHGECIGIIGPNGAGKSTLLKLINGDYQPDQGRIERNGRITALIRLGGSLQPLLTGRENIYIKCAELGFSKTETDALLERILAFSGLEKSLDLPVRRYSDGMYARLEFSIATCAPMDILLIDEVLAVGDIAFQMRCLQRLEQLKKAGSTILFVSHSEMNVRHIADRCLLLYDGEALALGETDTLFRKYYEATGFLDRALEPLGLAPSVPEDFSGVVQLSNVALETQADGAVVVVQSGRPITLLLHYLSTERVANVTLVLQFWSPTGVLVGTFDSGLNGDECQLGQAGVARLELPFLGLTAGVYRVAGGFRAGGRWLGYQSHLLKFSVTQPNLREDQGLLALNGRVIF